MIHSAAEVFSLNKTEEEILANKAGLSMKIDTKFPIILSNLLQNRCNCKELYEKALISERMFHHMKKSSIPTKQSLLALTIALGLSQTEIESILPKAGYVLSASIAYDVILKELLSQMSDMQDSAQLVIHINDVLYEFGLPLLMTRDKSIKT